MEAGSWERTRETELELGSEKRGRERRRGGERGGGVLAADATHAGMGDSTVVPQVSYWVHGSHKVWRGIRYPRIVAQVCLRGIALSSICRTWLSTDEELFTVG